MTITRRYAIIGTGALGGFYGGKLARAGLDVHFLFHSDYDHVKRNGLRVDSIDGDFHLKNVNAYASAADMPKCDVVIVSLKTTQNHLFKTLIPSVIADNGVVLLLQNGLGGEERIAEIVGPDRVMGGVCFLCSNKVGPGHIRHLDYGSISLGDFRQDSKPAGVTERMKSIGRDFETAGIKIQYADDLILTRWKKLVWNIPFNGLCAVMNATTDALIRSQPMKDLVWDIMKEVQLGAGTQDRRIDDAFLLDRMDYTLKMTPYRPSMMIDAELKRPLEIEGIFNVPLRMASEKGVDLPRIRMLMRQLAFIDEINQQTKA
ncbi:MAG: putative 2-dehydropantoate 2-reductase [Planctomycetota bacterium]